MQNEPAGGAPLDRGVRPHNETKANEGPKFHPDVLLAWAVGRWEAEVRDRPMVNKNRRTLDDTWRQVVRHLGGDPDALLGPSHDVLLDGPNARANARP